MDIEVNQSSRRKVTIVQRLVLVYQQRVQFGQAFFPAQLAGHRRDSAALETHLMAALRNGFDLQTLLADPIWREWAVDPELGPPIAGLIVVYGDESILEQLRSPQ